MSITICTEGGLPVGQGKKVLVLRQHGQQFAYGTVHVVEANSRGAHIFVDYVDGRCEAFSIPEERVTIRDMLTEAEVEYYERCARASLQSIDAYRATNSEKETTWRA